MNDANPNTKLSFSRTTVVDIGSTKIACHRHGQGQRVVCLHATGHSGRDFLDLAHQLGDQFEFIAVDWPGQGESPRGSVKASADEYSDILDAVITALQIDNYILIGNSIGGAAAIVQANRNSEGLAGLVLCNPGGLQPVNLIARLYCRHKARMFKKGEEGDPKFARKFRRYYEKAILPEKAAMWRREEIIATGYEMAPVLREAWESFTQSDSDIRSLVSTLSVPVLYAWARRDQAVSWGRSKKAVATTPNRSVELFDGGHCAFLESPDAFQRAFTAFADKLTAH